jgi:hypothetical protein
MSTAKHAAERAGAPRQDGVIPAGGPELSDDELEAVVGGLTRRLGEPIALGAHDLISAVPSMFRDSAPAMLRDRTR